MLKRTVFTMLRAGLASSAQTYLKGSFVRKLQRPHFLVSGNAKRLANIASGVRRLFADSLRRPDPFAAFLQPPRSAPPFAALCPNFQTPGRVSPGRPPARAALRNHGRSAAHQQDRDPAIQRHLPVAARPGAFPRSVHSAALLETVDAP